MTGQRVHRRVLLQGIDISSNVRRVEVEDHDRLIDEAKVLIDDPQRTTAEAPREGQTLLIEMGWDDQNAVLFEGEVTEVEVIEHACAPRQLRLRALDLSFRIRQRPIAPRNHTGTLSAILREIVSRAPATGIAVGTITVDPDTEYTDRNPLRQTTQNDWDFVQAQARRRNSRAFVEFNANQSKFYFLPIAALNAVDPMGRLTMEGTSGRILSLRYDQTASRSSARRTASVTDRDGVVTTVAAPTAPAAPDDTPGASALRRDAAAGGRLERAAPVLAEATTAPDDQRRVGFVAGLPSDPQRAREAALQDPTTAQGKRARGRCVGTINLRAKGQVELDGVTGWATGNWYVRKVKHIADVTRPDTATPGYACEFELTR
jgi:phage protein D